MFVFRKQPASEEEEEEEEEGLMDEKTAPPKALSLSSRLDLMRWEEEKRRMEAFPLSPPPLR